MVPIACQVARSMELERKRIEPSHKATLTPPGCRLRAALNCSPAVLTGISGSWFGIAQPTTSGAVLLGVVIVMNLKTAPSFWMSPRQSLSSWLEAFRVSDINSVFDVPSLMSAILVIRGLESSPLTWENGARGDCGAFGS